jgi:hypothetical protein
MPMTFAGLTADYRVRTVANNRTVDEWKLRSTRPDNHWLDCVVGSTVAASIDRINYQQNNLLVFLIPLILLNPVSK